MLSLRYAEEIDIVGREMVNFLQFTRDKIKALESKLLSTIDFLSEFSNESQVNVKISHVKRLCTTFINIICTEINYYKINNVILLHLSDFLGL